jgi:hypothetical protein
LAEAAAGVASVPSVAGAGRWHGWGYAAGALAALLALASVPVMLAARRTASPPPGFVPAAELDRVRQELQQTRAELRSAQEDLVLAQVGGESGGQGYPLVQAERDNYRFEKEVWQDFAIMWKSRLVAWLSVARVMAQDAYRQYIEHFVRLSDRELTEERRRRSDAENGAFLALLRDDNAWRRPALRLLCGMAMELDAGYWPRDGSLSDRAPGDLLLRCRGLALEIGPYIPASSQHKLTLAESWNIMVGTSGYSESFEASLRVPE